MKLPVYLSKNSFTVILDIDNNNKVLELMYQRELTLEKSVKNTIQIQFKNSDQKLLTVTPFAQNPNSLIFVMYNNQSKQMVLSIPLEVLDNGTQPLKGLAKLTLTPGQISHLPTGKYRYGIKVLDSDDYYVPAYVDTYYSASGTIEVRSSLDPEVRPSLEITNFQRFFNRDETALRYEYYSGNLKVEPEYLNPIALHTMAFYMTNFTGQVLVEATQNEDASAFSDYAIIQTFDYTGFTGIDYTTFQGVYSYVRLRWIPVTDPITATYNPLTSGTFDKLLYRS